MDVQICHDNRDDSYKMAHLLRERNMSIPNSKLHLAASFSCDLGQQRNIEFEVNIFLCRSRLAILYFPSLPGHEGVWRGRQLDVGDRGVLRLLPPSPPLPTARPLGRRRRRSR